MTMTLPEPAVVIAFVEVNALIDTIPSASLSQRPNLIGISLDLLNGRSVRRALSIARGRSGAYSSDACRRNLRCRPHACKRRRAFCLMRVRDRFVCVGPLRRARDSLGIRMPLACREQAGAIGESAELRALVVSDAELRRSHGRVRDETLQLQDFLHPRSIVADRIAPAVAGERSEPVPDRERANEILGGDAALHV